MQQGGVPQAGECGGAMDVGGIVWAASIHLSQHILDRSTQLQQALRPAGCGASGPIRVVELGCGASALPSLAASIAFAHCGVAVTATDLPAVLPSLAGNLEAHRRTLAPFDASVPAVASLSWGEPSISKDQSSSSCLYDDNVELLLAADCMYDVPALPLLLTTLRRFIGPASIALLAYQQRRKERESFVLDALREAGYNVEALDPSTSSGGPAAARGVAGVRSTVETFDAQQRAFLHIVEVRLGRADAAVALRGELQPATFAAATAATAASVPSEGSTSPPPPSSSSSSHVPAAAPDPAPGSGGVADSSVGDAGLYL